MTVETEGAAEAVTEDVVLPVDQVEQTDPSGDEAPAEPTPKPAKPKPTAQERFDELTREKYEAKREADYWREQALRTAPKAEPEAPKGDGRPDPSAYEYGAGDERYIEDLTDWKATQAVERKLTERDQRQQTTSAVETFEKRLAEQYPDGEPDGLLALRRLPQLPGAIQDVILTSEIGPKLADHLGANPAELRRLSALPPSLQGRELGKLEARLETPAAPRPKTATDAPDVAPTLRGVGGRFTVAPDTNDFTAFEKQFGG